jgi:phage shock protein PspC (stress-responsive transcriptional regulator)
MKMRKVTTVNLNGNAYQLEEAAYEKLREYLDDAEQKLLGSPDRTEIMGDLEQAIGDKCDTCLGAHKNVVSEAEVAQILREMGPVEGVAPDPGAQAGSAEQSSVPPAASPRGRRRLFRLPSEGMLGGVCAGLAAYTTVDVVWVRLAFLVLAFSTGIWFFVWLAMLFVMPVADTPEEIAAAHGEPLNAREVIERAKKKVASTFGRQAPGRGRTGSASAPA